MLEKNIGTKNRTLRFWLGVIFLILAFYYLPQNLIISVIGFVLAIILFIESFSSCCFIHKARKTRDMR